MADRDLQILTVSADLGEFTEPVQVNGEHLSVDVYADEGDTFTADVSLQRAFTEEEPSEGDWVTEHVYNEAAHDIVDRAGRCWYRIGCKSGDFTSGPVHLRLQKGRALV